MAKYSKEQRRCAVELYVRYECCAADMVRELGYPSREASRMWHRDWLEEQRTGVPSTRGERYARYTTEQKRAAVDHYLTHGRRASRTMRRLGYPSCLCSISCCGFSHDDFSGLGRACRPRNGLNWMVLVSPPERTGKDYDQHAPSTVYPSFAAERGIRRVDRAENTCQRADGA